ncbi:hypothetical protein E2C01_080114 [Portunus trituberculatus]|uniref:Uncharacterized protein n=1 Tax=Portunus trituberculatus TaxID=210409 RepID=A0A5B7IYP1_PORTR|nr:hypothetical protein [Portunus trituberculatus]
MSAVTRFKQSVSQSREGAQGTSSIARLRLGHTTLSAHLHRLHPFCPWYRTTPEAIEHFLLQCPRLFSQHTALRSWLSALAITILDLSTLLAASGVHLSLATCCPTPYFCLLEEDRPATMPVIPTQEYPRTHKNP